VGFHGAPAQAQVGGDLPAGFALILGGFPNAGIALLTKSRFTGNI